MRNVLPALAASLALALAATSALAHAQLESATPPVGGSVASPSVIRLAFSEGVEPKFSAVTVIGPGGAVALGGAATEAGHANVLVVPVTKPLAAGVYMVKWRAVSVDTHHTQGAFTFTVK